MSRLPDVAAANEYFAAELVDTLVNRGLTEAVVAPGSRSTPLALALARDARIRVHVVHDERSAGFFAVGIGVTTEKPAALVCTSGTAAANFLPAVEEAHHARVPMLVLTADRPPELQGVGAAQTINQTHLFGTAVRWFAEPDPPDHAHGHDGAVVWRRLAASALSHAMKPVAGPVHVNLAFREPLVGDGGGMAAGIGVPSEQDANGRDGARLPPASDEDLSDLVTLVRGHEQGVIVAGFGSDREVSADALFGFAAAAGWPVIADAVSGVRRPGTIGRGEAIVSSGRFLETHTPNVVLRVGAHPTVRALGTWLESLPHGTEHVLVDPFGAGRDPSRLATQTLLVDPTDLFTRAAEILGCGARASAWTAAWRTADAAAAAAADELLDGGTCPEARVARDFYAAVPDGGIAAVASSMPVRDLDAFAAPRDGVHVVANRGANGIDGFISTVIGAATATGAPTVALLGDLCFLHDSNGLLTAQARAVRVVLVVVDNDGGGIFSFLPQHDHCDAAEFETLFATPHSVDLVEIARAYGAPAARVSPEKVVPEVAARLDAGGVHVIVVPSDREANLAAHRELRAAMTRAVDSTVRT